MRYKILLQTFLVILVLTLIAGLFNPVAVQAEDASPERVVVRIHFTSTDQLNELAARLDVWEVHHQEGYLVALIRQADLVLYPRQGYRVEIDQAKTIEVNTPRQALPGQINGIPGYLCYRTVEETYAALQTLNTNYPGLVTITDIGDSWDKVTPGGPAGYDIFEIMLTNEATGTAGKPVFFLMAEIHAREYVTTETATRLAEYLAAGYGTNPDITWLLDHNRIHIVPLTNPDGRKFAESGQLWRKNTDNDDGCTSFPNYGTDLNRNHSFKWGGADPSPCAETYQGPSAASEPETQVIQNRTMALLEDRRGSNDNDPAPLEYEGLFITLHSYSGLVLWPWGWGPSPAPNNTQLQTLGRKLAYFNHYTPQQSYALYSTTGTSDDWAYGELGVPAYTFEMGTTFFQSCTSFENTIYPDNLSSLLYAFKAARQPYISPAGPDSLNPAVSESTVAPGTPVTLTATANDTRYENQNGAEPTQAIAAARYSVDNPSWVEGVVTHAMSAADGNFNSTIENVTAVLDTSGMLPGRHILFVESQDAAGNWGVPFAVFLEVEAPYAGLAVLAPPEATAFGSPGDVVQAVFTLTNAGMVADDFTLSVDSSWTAVVDPSAVTDLASGGSVEVTVTVTIPTDAEGQNVTTLQAIPADDPIYSDTSTLTTRLQYVEVQPPEDAKSGFPGDTVAYTFTVTNHDDIYRSFSVSISDNIWQTIPSTTLIGLRAGQSKEFTISVTIPGAAQPGDFDEALVTVTSRSEPAVFDTAVTLTTAIPRDVGVAQLTPAADAKSGNPGTDVIYTLTLTNIGVVEDGFTLGVVSTWTAAISPETVTLGSGESQEITVTVTIPPDGMGQDVAIVSAVPDDGTEYGDTSTLTTTAHVVVVKMNLPVIIR